MCEFQQSCTNNCFSELTESVECIFCKLASVSFKKQVHIRYRQCDLNKCSRRQNVTCNHCENEIHNHKNEIFTVTHSQFLEKFNEFVGDRPNIRKLSFRHKKPIWVLIKLINKTNNETSKAIELFCNSCRKVLVYLVVKPGPYTSNSDLEKIFRDNKSLCMILTKNYFHFSNRFQCGESDAVRDLMLRDICRDFDRLSPFENE